MAVKVKWDINGKGVDPASGDFGYKGPNLPKGSYIAKVKRATLSEIKSEGANKGKPRISVLLEVVGGAETDGKPALTASEFKYMGAPVWDGLNIIDSSVPFVNAFLHALTDGSDKGKRDVEHAFWDMDKVIRRVKVEKGPRAGTVDKHLISFGKYKLNSPNGEVLVQITTKAGADLKGNYRPEVTGYLPYDGEQTKGIVASEDEDEDEDELLGDEGDEPDEDDYDDEDSDEDDAEDEDDEDLADAASTRKTPPF